MNGPAAQLRAYLASGYPLPADLVGMTNVELSTVLVFTASDMSLTPGWIDVGLAEVRVTLKRPETITLDAIAVMRQKQADIRKQAKAETDALEARIQHRIGMTYDDNYQRSQADPNYYPAGCALDDTPAVDAAGTFEG